MARPRPATPLADELDAPVLGAGRLASAGTPSFTPVPDIAPPLVLEPIPAPVLLVVETPEPEPEPEPPAADDPYAWASQAASELERAGRSFDDLQAPPGLIVPPPPPAPEPPARPDARIRFTTPEPPGEPANPPRAPAPPTRAPTNPPRLATPPPRTPTNPPRAPAPPPRATSSPVRASGAAQHPSSSPARVSGAPRRGTPDPASASNGRASFAAGQPVVAGASPQPQSPTPSESRSATGMRLLVGAGGLMLAGIAALLVVVATGLMEKPEPPLRPLGDPPSSPPRYAVPETPVQRPPGSDAAALGAVAGRPVVAAGARLEVVSDPPGAKVMLDGHPVGTSPVTIPTSAGTHALHVEIEGLAPIERVVQLKAGSTRLELAFDGVLASGPVRVIATGWEGALLRVDGRAVGVVPVTLDLAQGDHTFELELGRRRLDLQRAVTPVRGPAAVLDLGAPATPR